MATVERVGASLAVVLSELEIANVVSIANNRRVRNIARRPGEPYGTPTVGLWGNEIDSSGAEYAVALVLNQSWNMGGPDVSADVGHDIQVRQTKRENGKLILHGRDKEYQRFYLVTGRMPTYTIRGWLLAADGKVERYWDESLRTAAYMVPQEELNEL